jgi:broad specificity phosphatase PhoE
MSERTIVHLMRHGEVHNPEGVLYGRLPEFVLSELGHQMAKRAAEFLSKNEIVHMVASPLERAQQTAEPLSKLLEVPVVTDDRVIEADNLFEGKTVGVGNGAFSNPSNWWMLRNPIRPSWGEPYKEIAARMKLAVWIARRAHEQKTFVHDPRKRQCTLASLTSLYFDGDEFIGVTYSEPARDLLPAALRGKVVGGA